jgi:hypothetical protein
MLSLPDIIAKLHIVDIFLIADTEVIRHRLIKVQVVLRSVSVLM